MRSSSDSSAASACRAAGAGACGSRMLVICLDPASGGGESAAREAEPRKPGVGVDVDRAARGACATSSPPASASRTWRQLGALTPVGGDDGLDGAADLRRHSAGNGVGQQVDEEVRREVLARVVVGAMRSGSSRPRQRSSTGQLDHLGVLGQAGQVAQAMVALGVDVDRSPSPAGTPGRAAAAGASSCPTPSVPAHRIDGGRDARAASVEVEQHGLRASPTSVCPM